jgi:hypothetical protein
MELGRYNSLPTACLGIHPPIESQAEAACAAKSYLQDEVEKSPYPLVYESERHPDGAWSVQILANQIGVRDFGWSVRVAESGVVSEDETWDQGDSVE